MNQIRATGELKLATSADFEPFNFEKGGQMAGFEVELGNLLAAKLRLKPVWVKDDFSTLLNNFDIKGYDVVIASHAITSTRAQVADFTNPHYCTGGVSLTHKGGPLTGKAMENQILGAEAGSTYVGFIQKLSFKKQLKVFANSGQAIQAAALGTVTATVTDKFAALQARSIYPKANLIVGPLLWRESVGMAVLLGERELKTGLNVALAELMNDGSYEQLSKKYFGEDIRC